MRSPEGTPVDARPRRSKPKLAAPYLDVMTIHTRQMLNKPERRNKEFSHNDLLVEPVHVPNLTHTGVGFGLNAAKYPLFYPNGSKNCNFRHVIQETLRSSVSTGELPIYMSMKTDSAWDSNFSATDTSILEQPSRLSKPSFNSSIASKLQQASVLSNEVKRRNNINTNDRKNDAKARELLQGIRSNSRMISHLM